MYKDQDYNVVYFSAYDEWRLVLPHECDEWIIGKKENVRAMIKDLQIALEQWPDDALPSEYPDTIRIKR